MVAAGAAAPSGPGDVDAWLTGLRAGAVGASAPVLAALAAELAARVGMPPAVLAGLRLAHLADPMLGAGPWGEPVPAGAGPGLLGLAHEVLLDRDGRRRRGAFYTPADVAGRLVGAALPGAAGDGVTVCDPACGGGAFLLAAAEHLAAARVDPATIVTDALWGVDLDPLAVAVTEAVLVLWAWSRGATPTGAPHVRAGDALLDGVAALADPPPDGFDLVVGNPPFLNQLERATARAAADRARLRERFGDAAYRYTDTAALFLVEATRLARPGGVVALVLPDAVLVAADARRARDAALERAEPVGLWWAGEPVFAAGVRVCAPVLRVRVEGTTPSDGGDAPVARWTGRAFTAAPPLPPAGGLVGAPSWAPLLAGLTAAPTVALGGAGVLGDRCAATAGFRDQFYGIRDHVRDAPDADPGAAVPLVTSGLIDPARCLWGRRPTRFAGHSFKAPVVDLDGLRAADPSLAAWADARLVPKVVVATQTRVVEAAVDVEGRWFPSVPTIAVTAPPARLWHVAAALLAPPVSAWALARHAGAALSADAIKLSARQVLEIPLPADDAAWDEGAARLAALSPLADPVAHREALEAFGAVMNRAYGAMPEVLAWWIDRLPRRA